MIDRGKEIYFCLGQSRFVTLLSLIISLNVNFGI